MGKKGKKLRRDLRRGIGCAGGIAPAWALVGEGAGSNLGRTGGRNGREGQAGFNLKSALEKDQPKSLES